MTYNKVVILSPPFYSHFNPLLNLGRAFAEAGAEVVVACSERFHAQIEDADLRFAALDINRNANTGVAQQTRQAREEAERLAQFFAATREGPIATLTLQSRHRREDMLTDPVQLREEIAALAEAERPDLFVVDQLSYAVTLALTCLRLPFVTFCPGHPTYVPRGDQLFGVPYAWPREFDVSDGEIAALRATAAATRDQFTAIFNELRAAYDPTLPKIEDAFRLTSQQAILFNYPDFGRLHQDEDGIQKIFLGYSFHPESLSADWETRLQRAVPNAPKILLTFGTFLSARDDVLARCIEGIKGRYPEALLVVSAGANVEALARYADERTFVERFVPQKALLPEMDLVIHHGGNNSFTETLSFGKPMLILPFSSDQFAIAHDAQREGLAACLAPNTFGYEELAVKMTQMLNPARRPTLTRWRDHVRARGPAYGVRRLLAGRDADA
jgi:UDP:flavonoid glycosyltransferase YjiC (YdhE family)